MTEEEREGEESSVELFYGSSGKFKERFHEQSWRFADVDLVCTNIIYPELFVRYVFMTDSLTKRARCTAL